MGATTGIKNGVESSPHHEATPVLTPVSTLVWKPLKPLEASPTPPHQIPVETSVDTSVEPLVWEWRTEWKRHTEGYRSISKRLWVLDAGRWRQAKKTDREQGLIAITGPLNKRLRNFSMTGERKISKIGEQNVKRAIEGILNRGTRTERAV